ncbi:MAG TPA: hypothetical protein VHO50_07485 [Bacteroidales bacterium]|nr:hypothetical protein [Bacteroidales bacterium]
MQDFFRKIYWVLGGGVGDQVSGVSGVSVVSRVSGLFWKLLWWKL